MIDKKLLQIFVCPKCKGNLYYDKKKNELVCLSDALAFPVKDEIPIMLMECARTISISECEEYQ